MQAMDFKVQDRENSPGARASKLSEPMWTLFLELHTGTVA